MENCILNIAKDAFIVLDLDTVFSVSMFESKNLAISTFVNFLNLLFVLSIGYRLIQVVESIKLFVGVGVHR